jgi:hypothetical protein
MDWNWEDFVWESSDDSLWEVEADTELARISGANKCDTTDGRGNRKTVEPEWTSQLLEDSGIDEKLLANPNKPNSVSDLIGTPDTDQNWITDLLYRESNLEEKWTMELLEERMTLDKLTSDCDDFSPQNLLRTLGKKEGELEGFKELLNKAETALRQSEDAVQVQFKNVKSAEKMMNFCLKRIFMQEIL